MHKLKVFKEILIRILVRIKLKLRIFDNIHYYEKDIKVLSKNSITQLRKKIININSFDLKLSINSLYIYPFGKEILINLENWQPKDNFINKDNEFIDQIFRFDLFNDKNYQEKLYEIYFSLCKILYIEKNKQKEKQIKKFSHHPYNISHRIINMILHLESNKYNQNKLFIIENFIVKETICLIKNLEIYDKLTCNHIINNIRAIVYAANYFNNTSLAKLALCLMKKWGGILFKNGLLREQSTHYQLLVTNWIIEINFLLDKTYKSSKEIKNLKDASFAISKLIYGDIDKGIFPIFGDISPDIKINKLVNKLRNQELVNHRDSQKNKVMINYKFIGNEFFKASNLNWTLFCHLPEKVIVDYPTHGHQDYGSIILWRNNEEVILSPGRKSYADKDSIRQDRFNTIKLNSKSLYKSRLFEMGGYGFPKPRINIINQKDNIMLEIFLHGYSNWPSFFKKSSYVSKRTIIIGNDYIDIEDKSLSKNITNIESSFLLSKKVKIKNKHEPKIQSDFINMFVLSESFTNISEESYFLDYQGCDNKANRTILCNSGANLINKIRFT